MPTFVMCSMQFLSFFRMEQMNNVTQDNEKIIIYDIGSNNGDDIPYYLKKADVVVAVEANPALCQQIQERFLSEISQGKLIIENCVLTANRESESVPFYLHKEDHVLSQFPYPRNPEQFERVLLPSKSVSELFEHGFPHYVKIDIEGYDQVILRSIFDSGIKPNYISAESHCLEVFLTLTTLGNYNSFKIVEGVHVFDQYRDHSIKTMGGEEVYSFPYHSAGPFGEDVMGNWMDSKSLFHRLQLEGLGWKDIHAKREDLESNELQPQSFWHKKYWLYRSQWVFSPLLFLRIFSKANRKIKRTLNLAT